MLKIEHISKTFNPGTVNEKQAIRDLSLNLEKGDFATIIGSNGAGKSTLFNAICGDFLTDSGVIMLDGQDITFMPQHVRAKTIGRLSAESSEMSIWRTRRLMVFQGKAVMKM